MVPGSRAGVRRDHCRHNNPTFSPGAVVPPALASRWGQLPGALTGAAGAAAERVRRAVGLGHIMVDVADRRGQSVATGTRTWRKGRVM